MHKLNDIIAGITIRGLTSPARLGLGEPRDVSLRILFAQSIVMPKNLPMGAYRLPTEAEWAFACRGGNPGRYSFGDDDAMLKHYAWVLDGDRHGASEVGFKLANAFGLFDMHGNVWEWCQDWHGTYPSYAVIDPIGPESGESRVSRGGPWGGPWGGSPEICRSTFRSWGINA